MVDLNGLMYPRTPTGAGSILPSPPWHYSGEMMTIEFRTDPANVAELLPARSTRGRRSGSGGHHLGRLAKL